MYRRGPTKSTPASVQCQKCLKRGHYSYECKASAQERPYIPRPSRTQQLLNPKLVPKLTSDVPDTLQKKKGVADEELAKIEAERAKKRELDQDDSDGAPPKRARSSSYDSVSSISTRRSLSPPPQAQQSSAGLPDEPRRCRKGPLPVSHASRRQSYSSASDYERRYSPSPSRQAKNDRQPRSLSRGSRSPPPEVSPVRSRRSARDEAADQESTHSRRRRYSSSPSRSPPRRDRRHFRSRSRDQPRRRDRSPPRQFDRPASRDAVPIRGSERRREEAPPRRVERRERSLSPFSKRLALTQQMNTGR
ncbi:zinc knuckle-domain-containing protein [Hypoxylon rubiginosum]|uniref:Zinc knuckle-domain-containing protein n=1 Tax=Hypoxylon rubiginosum TaxID=110542 RepID=A0ACC0DHU6_9PEZI|nr:zinc knuckle-domain-containing protein [Hypoxylon rubiginosum]